MSDLSLEATKKRVSEARDYYKEMLLYSDRRQHAVDDLVTTSELLVASIFLPLSLGVIGRIIESSIYIRFLFGAGIILMGLSLFLGITHLAIKNRFWKKSGQKFSWSFDLLSETERLVQEADKKDQAEHLRSNTMSAIDAIFDGNSAFSQASWSGELQSWFLGIGSALEIFAILLLIFGS